MRFGVVVFPGSNCDHDAWYAVHQNLGQEAEFIWHDSRPLGDVDAVILPGGFSYGDYLRCGAIAKFSPVMHAVKKFAADGGLVLGICNGFQILVEAGLLPGALVRIAGLKFVCREVHLRTETTDSPFTGGAQQGPDPARARSRTAKAAMSPTSTPSMNSKPRTGCCSAIWIIPTARLRDIAGILNRERNVMGMMPHPERASDPLMGSTEVLFSQSMVCRLRGTHDDHHARSDRHASTHRRRSTTRSSPSWGASRVIPSWASSA